MTQKKKEITLGIVCLFFSAILIAVFLPVFLKTEVVHLIVLAGQSNCEGVSSCEELKKYISEKDYQQYENGFENVRIKYNTNLVNPTAFVTCKLGQGTNANCFGLEIGMGDYLSKNFPNEKFYFVKRAHGGTPIFPYWNAPENEVEIGVYLRLLIEDVRNSIKELERNHKKVVVDAFCWMQGESDADEMEKVNSYQHYLSGMVAYFRDEFRKYNENEIRFVDCGITDYEPAEIYYHEELNKEKIEFSKTNENNFYIDIAPLGLTKNREPNENFPDYWHFDSESMLKLGKEFGARCGDVPIVEEDYTKVVILSGQSNMLGFSRVDLLTDDKIGKERLEYLNNSLSKVKIINENMDDFMPMSLGIAGGAEGAFGPEVGVAEILSKTFDEEVYVIKCAFGGTSLYESWRSPSMTDDGSVSYCYKLFLDTVNKGLAKLEGKNPKIVGFCWMQGEADAEIEEHSMTYLYNLTKFVNDLRAEFADVSLGGKLNFIDAKINQHFTYYQNVNNQKEKFEKQDKCNHLLDTLAPNLVCQGKEGLIHDEEPSISIFPIDPLHYDSVSMLKLGTMFGQKLAEIVGD